jgi:hypothetical protein
MAAGLGWEKRNSPHLRALGGSLVLATRSQVMARPLAALFAGAVDPLSPDLLHAAARGWPLLLHRPDGRSLDGLGGVLRPEEHFATFSGRAGLIERLTSQRSSETVRRRAERAAAHVQVHHTWRVRLAELKSRLESGAFGEEPRR